MSGHSKWHSIKHKKAAADSKRGKVFTKLIKEISVAARIGGGDVDSNPRLRTAVQAAKAANMPLDNIKRAVMKGTGELPGQSYESVTYEGYGPGGVAVLVEALTDNKNRTVAELRHLFSKNGGNLGETGCVNWMFGKKGYFAVPMTSIAEDQLMDVVLEAGAEDINIEGETYAVYCPMEKFERVKQALEAAGVAIQSSELTMIPQNAVRLEGRKAEQMLKLMETLEDHDDVQNVYANFDIDESEMEAIASAG
ncbi:MAG: YebC/PmpR family DNA-binding transcriptional regulator [Acidobacteria bacterium]|nr:YebC/PmpR family DNA-binding transcriptional regulator [Acidobacteriota bacterium]